MKINENYKKAGNFTRYKPFLRIKGNGVFKKKIKETICLLIYLILIVLLYAPAVGAFSNNINNDEAGFEADPYCWYEFGVQKKVWRAMDEIAVFKGRVYEVQENIDILTRQIHPNAVVSENDSLYFILKLPEFSEWKSVSERIDLVGQAGSIARASPVFYKAKNRDPKLRYVLTGKIIVQFTPNTSASNIKSVEDKYGLKIARTYSFAQNTFLYEVADVMSSIQVANDIYENEDVNYSYPNWLRAVSFDEFPDDPLFPDLWNLYNNGQGFGTPGEDVNITVEGDWGMFKGSYDEVIAIVEFSGVEISHEDLSENIRIDLCWDFLGDDLDPSPEAEDDNHGTACAGIAAARGFNLFGSNRFCTMGFFSWNKDYKIARR